MNFREQTLKTLISGGIRASSSEIRNQGEKSVLKVILRPGPAGNIAPGNLRAGPASGNHSPDRLPIRSRIPFKGALTTQPTVA